MLTRRAAFVRAVATVVAVAASLLAHGPSAAAPAAKRNIFGIWLPAYMPGGDERWRTKPFTPRPEFTAWGKAESDRMNTHETPGQCDPWNPVYFMGPVVPFPIQILDGGNQVVLLQEVVTAPRRIYTDGRKHPADVDPTFGGHSIGHWEGDTFIVDTVGLNGRARPLNGYPAAAVTSASATEPRLPASDQAHIVERYRLVEKDVLEGVTTIQDPKTYTTPSFSITRYYRRSNDTEMYEYACSDNERIEDEGQSTR